MKMKQKKMKVKAKCLKTNNIVLGIMFILTAVVFVWYIIGENSTVEQMVMIILLVMMFFLTHQFARVEAKLDHLVEQFFLLTQDFKQHAKHKK